MEGEGANHPLHPPQHTSAAYLVGSEAVNMAFGSYAKVQGLLLR